MEQHNILEVNEKFPGGVFVNGAWTAGEIINGKFKSASSLDLQAEESKETMTEIERITYNFHLAMYMDECFPHSQFTQWREVAKYEFQLLQKQMVNGKRRIKLED